MMDWYLLWHHDMPAGMADEVTLNAFIRAYSVEGNFVAITPDHIEMDKMQCVVDSHMPCLTFERVTE